jgi:transcriptional regulator with XRE-family HTH domain
VPQLVSSEQIRAARAILRWDQGELAKRAGISVETVKRLEAVDGYLMKTRTDTLIALHKAFKQAGIRFSEAPGEMCICFPDPEKNRPSE